MLKPVLDGSDLWEALRNEFTVEREARIPREEVALTADEVRSGRKWLSRILWGEAMGLSNCATREHIYCMVRDGRMEVGRFDRIKVYRLVQPSTPPSQPARKASKSR